MLKYIPLVLLFAACSSPATKNEAPENNAPVASNAPADKATTLKADEAGDYLALIEKASAEALKTLPEAKNRFLKNHKADEAFFLTINLKEGNSVERVFVRVTKWSGDKIGGTIANEIVGLTNYKQGQEIEFSESEIMDWTFSKPDGTEDGNYIGKALDAM